MGDRDLASDSDSSDEDYVPEGAEKEPVSEDESAHDTDEQPVSDGEDAGEERKRKKSSRKKARKKLKSSTVDEKDSKEDEQEGKPEVSAADKKQKADALWADFLKDCDPPVRKKQALKETNVESCEKVEEQTTKPKVVEEYHFAGEKVLIEKDIADANGTVTPSSAQQSVPSPMRGKGRAAARGGIASILGQLGKKNKLSTLQKSKLDWDMFKKDEGIQEEIEQHNKGKNGYLERQDFLERADLRQFEIEKSLRAAKRSSLR